MDLARIKPNPGAIYQVLVEPDTAVEDVAVHLAEHLSTEAIICLLYTSDAADE